MVNDQTFALPLAQPATTLSNCFQPRGFADIHLHKSLKNNDLYPPLVFRIFFAVGAVCKPPPTWRDKSHCLTALTLLMGTV